MARFERTSLLKKFRAMAAKGEPIVGGGAGTGLSAKCEEAGGVDLIVMRYFPRQSRRDRNVLCTGDRYDRQGA